MRTALRIINAIIPAVRWVLEKLIWTQIELEYRTLGEVEYRRQFASRMDILFAPDDE